MHWAVDVEGFGFRRRGQELETGDWRPQRGELLDGSKTEDFQGQGLAADWPGEAKK